MKIIHDNGYTKEDCLRFRPLILNNTLGSLITILNAMKKVKINLSNPDRVKDAKLVVALAFTIDLTKQLSNELSGAMKRLWSDNNVQLCFSLSREYQLNDSAK